jgi:Protein of unknown function (DUF2750)
MPFTRRRFATDLWGIKDAAGFPAPKAADGVRAMPFWSLKSRAERVIETVPPYAGFEPVEIPLTDWRSRWLPDLADKGARIGLNWSGMRATGDDVESDVDVCSDIATAKVRSQPFVEYVHIARFDGRWLIVNTSYLEAPDSS